MGYKKQAIKGISWMGMLRVATRSFALVETIILARILVPSQYGAYGVALLVLGLLEVMTETGINIVLIQESEPDKYTDSAWIVSIIRGFLIGTIIYLSSPFVAQFFNSKDALILLKFTSIVPILRGFINPSIIKFQKNLHFNLEFWYRTIILFVDTLFSILLTLILRSPLGIIFGLIAGVIIEMLLSYIVVKPIPHLKFEKEYFYSIFHRGKWVTASSIFNYLFYNADNIIVGRILGTSALGVYQIGYSLSILPITEVAEVLHKVSFPILRKMDGDLQRLKRAFSKIMFLACCLTIPYGLLLFLFPKEIVGIILGNKWLAVVTILPILAIFGTIRGISVLSTALFLAVEKQKYSMITTLVSILGLMIPIIPLVYSFGIKGAAMSALFGSLITLPFVWYFIARIVSRK